MTHRLDRLLDWATRRNATAIARTIAEGGRNEREGGIGATKCDSGPSGQGGATEGAPDPFCHCRACDMQRERDEARAEVYRLDDLRDQMAKRNDGLREEVAAKDALIERLDRALGLTDPRSFR